MKLNLSESIRRLRRECDMTQETVADALGVTYQAVSRWETGQSYPDIELLPALAALFDVNMDCLFGIDKNSEEVQIEKFSKEEEKLKNVDDQIALVRKYIETFPGMVYFKTRLLELYFSKGVEYTEKKLSEMRRLCQYVVDHTEESDWRRSHALIRMIAAEEDGNLDGWLSLLDRQSYYRSDDALKIRYDHRDEVDEYNRLIQRDTISSLCRCFDNNFCKRDKTHYKDARSRMEGQRVILRIIDKLRDPSTDEDGWIETRIFAYVRLAGGCFGCGEKEAGYAALEKCLELCVQYSGIPIDRELVYNSAVLDELTEKIKGGDFIKDSVIRPLTVNSGWEWFNDVRDEARFRDIITRAEKIYRNMSGSDDIE